MSLDTALTAIVALSGCLNCFTIFWVMAIVSAIYQILKKWDEEEIESEDGDKISDFLDDLERGAADERE